MLPPHPAGCRSGDGRSNAPKCMGCKVLHTKCAPARDLPDKEDESCGWSDEIGSYPGTIYECMIACPRRLLIVSYDRSELNPGKGVVNKMTFVRVPGTKCERCEVSSWGHRDLDGDWMENGTYVILVSKCSSSGAKTSVVGSGVLLGSSTYELIRG